MLVSLAIKKNGVFAWSVKKKAKGRTFKVDLCKTTLFSTRVMNGLEYGIAASPLIELGVESQKGMCFE